MCARSLGWELDAVIRRCLGSIRTVCGVEEGKERLEDQDVEKRREAASLLDSVFRAETFSSVAIDFDKKVVFVEKEAD